MKSTHEGDACTARATGGIGRAAGILLVVCCMVWGVNQVAIKIANEGFPPVLQATIRSVLATLLLLGFMRARGISPWQRDGTLAWGLMVGTLFELEFVAP